MTDFIHSDILQNGYLTFMTLFSIFLLSRIISSIITKPSNIPTVTGGLPFFGQVFVMMKGSPWDTMANWVQDFGLIYKIHLFGSDMICISDPKILKIVLSTKLSIFKKDLEWTYKPFLVILGKGLVTADGINHRNQRKILASHFRTDILDCIPQLAVEAFHRFCVKLDKVKHANHNSTLNNNNNNDKLSDTNIHTIAKSNNSGIIEMSEEFRTLTLQVIAAAICSLPPSESDQTFAHMYLPIVEEGNKRTWNPERGFIPNQAFFEYQTAVKRLNDYVTDIIIKRRLLRLQEGRNFKGDNDHIPINKYQDQGEKGGIIDENGMESPRSIDDIDNDPAASLTWRTTTTSTGSMRKQDVLDIRMDSITEDEWNSSIHTNVHGKPQKSPSSNSIPDKADGDGQDIIQQICDEVKTFILAGHETSASMLTWALYELSRNPEYLEKIRQEALIVFKGHLEVIPNDDDDKKCNNKNSNGDVAMKTKQTTTTTSTSSVSTIRQKHKLKDIHGIKVADISAGLSFTEAALRESLRRYAVVPSVVRMASEDITIDPNTMNIVDDKKKMNISNNSSNNNSSSNNSNNNYFIQKGSTIIVNIQGVHHNPQYWPEPFKYDPTRFLGSQEIQPYTFLPFIEGPRMCIGQYLSLLESKIVLASLILAYDFEIVNVSTAGDKHAFMIPIIPNIGHYMKIS